MTNPMPHPQVTAYIAAAPADQREALTDLRTMITAALPHAAEELSPTRFPVYTVNAQWITGFATRKKSPMFYMMLHDILTHHAARLGPLITGKSCIEYRPSKSLPMDDLRDTVQQMLAAAAAAHPPR